MRGMMGAIGSDLTDEFLHTSYSNKRVLITGGWGLLESNIANRLSAVGARVTILDSLHPMYGGNRFNLDPQREERIRVVIGDVRNQKLVEELVADADIIYHFAAQVSYIDSGNIPFEDMDVNQTSTLG